MVEATQLQLNHTEQQIEHIIVGLKGLYTKLSIEGKKHNEEDANIEAVFDTEADQTLLSLRELFLSRVNENRMLRLKMNSVNPMMRVSRVIYLT